MSKQPNITLTARKLSTGYKLFVLLCDDMTHAHNVAKLIMQGSDYARCYIVATDWEQNVLFSVMPGGRAGIPAAPQLPPQVQAPPVHFHQVQQAPSYPAQSTQYAQYGANPYGQPTQRLPALPPAAPMAPRIIEAEIVDEPRGNVLAFRR